MTEPIYDGDAAVTSVAKAKDWLRLHANKGVRCRCCKQHVKVYRRGP